MGTFNTSSALEVKTSNSPIRVTVNAFNPDSHAPTKVKLHTSNRLVSPWWPGAHLSSELSHTASSPPRSLCSLHPRVNRTAASSSARTLPTRRSWSTLRNTRRTRSSNYKPTRPTRPPTYACNPPLRVPSICERPSSPPSSPPMSAWRIPQAVVGSVL